MTSIEHPCVEVPLRLETSLPGLMHLASGDDNAGCTRAAAGCHAGPLSHASVPSSGCKQPPSVPAPTRALLRMRESRAARAQIERDEELHTFQAISNRFRFPYEQSLSTNPLYYSLDVGPIHVVMLNAVRPRAPA